MTAVELLASLQGLGVQVEAAGDRIRTIPRGGVPLDLQPALFEGRAELLALLTSARARRMVRYERADDAGHVAWRLVRVLDGSRLPDRDAGLFVGRDWARAWAIAHRYEVVEVEAPEPPPRELRDMPNGSAPCDLAQGDGVAQSEER